MTRGYRSARGCGSGSYFEARMPCVEPGGIGTFRSSTKKKALGPFLSGSSTISPPGLFLQHLRADKAVMWLVSDCAMPGRRDSRYFLRRTSGQFDRWSIILEQDRVTYFVAEELYATGPTATCDLVE